jgi:hypothetical protein
VPVQDVKQAEIAFLDDGLVLLGAANQRHAAHLAVVEGRHRRLPARSRLADHSLADHPHLRELAIVGVVPAIVEHHLGNPLVAEILDQVGEEGETGIGGNDAARVRMLPLQLISERR